MPRRTTLVSSHDTHSQRGNHHLRRAVYHSLPLPQLTTPCLMTFPSPGEGLCACSRRLGSCAQLLTHGVVAVYRGAGMMVSRLVTLCLDPFVPSSAFNSLPCRPQAWMYARCAECASLNSHIGALPPRCFAVPTTGRIRHLWSA